MATEVVKKEFVRKSQIFFQFRHILRKKNNPKFQIHNIKKANPSNVATVTSAVSG